jgi:hypothetical protein
MRRDGLIVRAAPGKGRGVFAARAFMAGELIERAVALTLSEADTDAIAICALDAYYFRHPTDPEGGLLVLGLATLVNHADLPNAETVCALDRDVGWTVTLRATRMIAAGEEVTRRYACALWFDPV